MLAAPAAAAIAILSPAATMVPDGPWSLGATDRRWPAVPAAGDEAVSDARMGKASILPSGGWATGFGALPEPAT